MITWLTDTLLTDVNSYDNHEKINLLVSLLSYMGVGALLTALPELR